MLNVYVIPEIVHWIGDGRMMPGDYAFGRSWRTPHLNHLSTILHSQLASVHLTRVLNGSSQNFPDTGTQTKGGEVWT